MNLRLLGDDPVLMAQSGCGAPVRVTKTQLLCLGAETLAAQHLVQVRGGRTQGGVLGRGHVWVIQVDGAFGRVVRLQLRGGLGPVHVVGGHGLFGHDHERVHTRVRGCRVTEERVQVDLPERALLLHVTDEVGHGGVGVVTGAQVFTNGVHDGHAVGPTVGVDHDHGPFRVARVGQNRGPFDFALFDALGTCGCGHDHR